MARGAALTLVTLLSLLLAACTAQSSGSWQDLGPSDGSIVLSMVTDAKVPQVIYAGTDQGQVLRTRTDANGTETGKGLPTSSQVSALAAAPDKAGVVYAGTSAGLYMTTNYGDTWTARGQGLPQGDTVSALAILPAHTSTLYAGTTEHGVYLSQDAGATWAALNTGLPAHANVYAFGYDPASNMVFVGMGDGSGIFASAPGTATWSAHNSGVPSKSDIFALLAVPAHDSTPAQLYAGTSAGLLVSADGGASWTMAGLSGSRVLCLASDPATPSTVYAGTDNNVYRGVNAQNWQPVAPGIQHQVAAVLARPGTAKNTVVFAGSQDVLRYPPTPTAGASSVGVLASVVILLGLVAVLFLVLRRSARILHETMSPGRRGGGASRSRRGGSEREGDARGAHNGHDPSQLPTQQ